MFTKLSHVCGILLVGVACLVMLMPQLGEAARREPVHTMQSVKTSETIVDGEKALRIELGFDNPDISYTTSTKPYLQKQLILDLRNTEPGKVKSDYKVKNKLAKAIHIDELEARHTQVRIDFTNPVLDGTYKIHEEAADRKARKPHRLVIDIFAQSHAASADRVDGVRGHVIVLDPGHGGSDTGAVGPTGVTEASVTLSVAKQVDAILENSGARVTMTRTSDRDVYGPYASDRQELQARVNVGEYTPGAELFLSIHCNAFSNPAAHGMETYYYSVSSKGQRLATLLNEELEQAGGLLNRGVKTANFYVIKHSSMPASLVELGFITNDHEEALLADASYQAKLAKAIAKALGRYFEGR